MQNKTTKNKNIIGISQSKIDKHTHENNLEIGNIICGGKLYSDFSFIIIIIPLWFNIIKDYVAFTDKGVLFIFKDLWSTPKLNFLTYEQIQYIIVKQKRKKEIKFVLTSGKIFTPRFNMVTFSFIFGNQYETVKKYVEFEIESK